MDIKKTLLDNVVGSWKTSILGAVVGVATTGALFLSDLSGMDATLLYLLAAFLIGVKENEGKNAN